MGSLNRPGVISVARSWLCNRMTWLFPQVVSPLAMRSCTHAACAGAAAVVAYSRVYVGAHYPGDVLAGLALGVGIGWPWAALMLGGSGLGAKKRGRGR